jgi:hypothetical protein
MRVQKKRYYPGDFSFMDDENWSIALIDGYNAVESVGPTAWEELKKHKTKNPLKYGHNIVINSIYHNIAMTHDTQIVYQIIMRNMEYIAKNGWDDYVKFWTNLSEK